LLWLYFDGQKMFCKLCKKKIHFLLKLVQQKTQNQYRTVAAKNILIDLIYKLIFDLLCNKQFPS
jgi:predicted DCC family thiol-disulfide oxidoreductase YuxK